MNKITKSKSVVKSSTNSSLSEKIILIGITKEDVQDFAEAYLERELSDKELHRMKDVFESVDVCDAFNDFMRIALESVIENKNNWWWGESDKDYFKSLKNKTNKQ